MSNIANQLIAVVATLSGFVAHDFLSERSALVTVTAAPAVTAALDTTTTRAITLDGLSVEDWLAGSLRAERQSLRAPTVAMAAVTAPSRPSFFATDIRFADARANDTRLAGHGRNIPSAFLR